MQYKTPTIRFRYGGILIAQMVFNYDRKIDDVLLYVHNTQSSFNG